MTCAALGGMDDPNGCSGERSCSTTGHCLHIDQQMPVLNRSQRFVQGEPGRDAKFRQVVTFAEPGTLEEVRVLSACGGACQRSGQSGRCSHQATIVVVAAHGRGAHYRPAAV